MTRHPLKQHPQSGQTTVEYIVLLGVIVSLAGLVFRVLKDANLQEAFMHPLAGSYAKVYKYGHPDTKGPGESGGPKHHVRALRSMDDSTNFRIFLNPGDR